MSQIVTFDVFSALTNSRSGGSTLLDSVVEANGWPVSGEQIYARWDALNKERHRTVDPWVPFADISVLALRNALTEFELPLENAPDISRSLLESMAEWPLWPDVTAESLTKLGPSYDLGLLSNIDDALLADTAAVRLGVFEPDLVVSSERAQAYKPTGVLYRRAGEILGPFIHVASSARDVKGALSAGIACVRLARPGHLLDPTGPTPELTATSIEELPPVLAKAAERQ